MNGRTSDNSRILEACLLDTAILLKTVDWKSIHQFDVIVFYVPGTIGVCGHQISSGDKLQLNNEDSLVAVTERIKVLLKQYVPAESIPDKLLFAII